MHCERRRFRKENAVSDEMSVFDSIFTFVVTMDSALQYRIFIFDSFLCLNAAKKKCQPCHTAAAGWLLLNVRKVGMFEASVNERASLRTISETEIDQVNGAFAPQAVGFVVGAVAGGVGAYLAGGSGAEIAAAAAVGGFWGAVTGGASTLGQAAGIAAQTGGAAFMEEKIEQYLGS
jgi:hypothetical protein